MTTAKDLLIIAIEVDPGGPVGQGDLSLALAGAELIDLLGTRAVTLAGDGVVPAGDAVPEDRLLAEAAASLVRQGPYESVDDWLWRRGRDLFSAYTAVLEEEGQLTRQRRRRMSFAAARMTVADSPARRRALHRWAADEPVVLALAAAVGIQCDQSADEPGGTPRAGGPRLGPRPRARRVGGGGRPPPDRAGAPAPVPPAPARAARIQCDPRGEHRVLPDPAGRTVLAAVHGAVMELEAVRQRRSFENAAFANVWRGA
ncbi:GPP34 family phosphoprotein [Streptomyces sp. NPDC059466]|uniref:GOLPH3/VPS74 family protein n=1 Tax=Streptomyces sp. NPDC059466 TaxID=3346843 RepID=UPI0036A47CE0